MKRPVPAEALNNRDYLLLRAYQGGIRNAKELAAFMGQMQVESAGFRSMHENLNYRPARLLEVFPGRNGMDRLDEAKAITRGGAVVIANAMYGGKWGANNLGNTEPGDGWRFHGRGYVQLTGRANYRRAALETGLALEARPDLAADREVAAGIAIHFWRERVAAKGLQYDVRAATRAINGGTKHLKERGDATEYWQGRLTPAAMKALDQGEIHLGRISSRKVSTAESVGRIDMRDPAHPAHERYMQAFRSLSALAITPEQMSGNWTERQAAALVAASAHLTSLDTICVSQDGRRLFALERNDEAGSLRKIGYVDIEPANQLSVERSTRQWHEQQAASTQVPLRLSTPPLLPEQAGPSPRITHS